MHKQRVQTNEKPRPLTLQKETLRLAVGGLRIRIPIGYADDTTPIYGPDNP